MNMTPETGKPECASEELYAALRNLGYTGKIDYYGRAASGDRVADALWHLKAARAMAAAREDTP